MIAILKNNFRRLETQMVVLLIISITLAAVSAIFMSNNRAQKWNIALVSDNLVEFDSDVVNITRMSSVPPKSSLVTGKYDAILILNTDGTYMVDTIKNVNFSAQLLDVLEGRQSSPVLFNDRGIGTNILGFLMTFLLLMGSMCMSMFADDKEFGQFSRMTVAPGKIDTYLFAYSMFNFCFLFFPTMIILLFLKIISGVNFGFTFIQLSGLIALICLFSTAFSLLLFSLLSNKDNSAKMIGNSIIIITSILAGSFYAFDKSNKILSFIIQILPQKSFLTIANGLEQGNMYSISVFIPALYLLILIVIFYKVSILITRRSFINKH